ncbi:hypothetical protein [Actinoplanes sp. L3-i22]|uniref:hypothetical protein n=1 Tax=Actinoplanes sp. L3-i22 TaxID=2836373 RepID=UPI001C78AF23|nr:hypothetical protein [Actinoplanes sp. L3-i22]BCY07560.1 hypothetical protein L3i22_026480 [Actinoplanes sp. L3-i22]
MLIQKYLDGLLDSAAPYWQSRWAAGPRPGHMGRYIDRDPRLIRAVLPLLDHWTPDRLDRILTQLAPEWSDRIIDTLVEHVDVPPAEIESWIRGPLQGDIHRLRGCTMMHLWRDVFRDGTSAARAAASLGVPARAAHLTYNPRSAPPDLPFPSEARRVARDDFGLGLDEVDLLDPMRTMPAPVFAAFSRFRLAAWPADEAVLAALPSERGKPLSVALPEFARVACLTREEINGWQGMLADAGPGPLPLAEIWRLCTPALAWRRVGVPAEAAPWCAAAKLPPEEALAMHRAGTLEVSGLRTLALLSS